MPRRLMTGAAFFSHAGDEFRPKRLMKKIG